MSKITQGSDLSLVYRSPGQPSVFDDDAAGGDWALYKQRCIFVDTSPVISVEDATALKTHFALAYLGKRAQAKGGMYQRSGATVFSPAFIDRLVRKNVSDRRTRHPGLEQLVRSMHAETAASKSSGANNIIPSFKPQQKLHLVSSNSAGNIAGFGR